ncbi:MAG: hypothetical protein M0C28_46685 [Candidatus Moduliflexus flocculans]|nr:hypothetical protein [Candidatus Moduliflexus flocculans]
MHEIPDVGPDGKGKAIANLVVDGGGREDRRPAARCRSFGGRASSSSWAPGKGIVKKTDLVGLPEPAGRRASSPWASRTTTR